MANNRRPLKTYIRVDGSGRIIAGSSVRRQNKPKNSKWLEIPSYECCDPLTICQSTTTP